MWRRTLCLVGVIVWLSAAPATGAAKTAHGRVEIIRDKWGIPHVFSDTDAGAMYGLGFAAAEERAFQMYHSLRIIQGRLAELVGDVPKPRRRETASQNDRKMRTFGFHRAAAGVAGRLDKPTRAMLEAYCAGVNDYVAAHRGKLHPLFAKLALVPEAWTPGDCIASWWHLGQFFATDGTRDLLQYRNITNPRPGRPRPTKPAAKWRDDQAAVVQREDVDAEWLRRTEELAKRLGPPSTSQPAPGPKFSHAWAVGGRKTTTGSAVLVSDPQTPVRNPSLWHEFHVCGKTFNARGIGVPGSPFILIGWNEHVAWGVTALGADQADLFRLKTQKDRPNQYWFDGKWRAMNVRRETIGVKGGRPIPLTVRETHFGPVVTEFAFARPGDPQVALKRVPICETDRETIQALVPMLRARDARGFAKALRLWRFPSANIVFADRGGNIGYQLVAAVPIRSGLDAHGGRAAMDGTESKFDWRGYVAPDLLPRTINPRRGWLASANHRPIGSFYRIPLGVSTGWMGDTVRSWRLRERLAGRDRFTPKDVLAVHFDTVNPARREIVRIGYHLRDVLKHRLSDDAMRALKRLEPWRAGGSRCDLSIKGAELAMAINTFFRFVATPLTGKYGGGESGLCRFLKSVSARLAASPRAEMSDQERQFIDNALASAWRSAGPRRGPGRAKLGYFESLDGFGSLDPAGDLPCPPLTRADRGTILSQGGQSYTQYVPLGDIDAAMTVLPVGHGERIDDPHRTSTRALWQSGRLHPAPLRRAAVEKIAATRKVLSKGTSR